MCGRYALTLPPDAVRRYFDYTDQPNFPPRYNIAPTQPVPVLHLQDGVRRFRLMRWGFLPGWVKDPKEFPLVINIRSETVREKASFRAAFLRRRALMPADGFYEWQKLGRDSRPFLLRRPDRGPLAFAALHETWSSPDGSEIDTAALVNTTANGVIAAIHERSPVILPPEHFDAWLDPATPPDAARSLLQPPPDDLLEMIPIGRAVNKVANDDAAVQAPIGPDVSDDPPPSKPKPTGRGRDDRQGALF
jgi:putative SOS response-associated peptidase YedK